MKSLANASGWYHSYVTAHSLKTEQQLSLPLQGRSGQETLGYENPSRRR